MENNVNVMCREENTKSTKALSVIVISDPHYYSKRNWIDCDPFQFEPERDQQYRRGSEEIIKFVFDEVCREGEPDIVLINGDLTNNGEVTSHEEMRELLRSLKSRGKRVYVTTATHDYCLDNNGYSYGFDKHNNKIPVPAFSRNMLYEYYFEFGMNEALSVHRSTMSYSLQLNDDFMLLALNDDYGKAGPGYTDDCFEWIEKQVLYAKQNNLFIVAMTHHPLLAPSALYRLIAPGDLVENGVETAKRFADWGIPCIFTGHSHIHNISSVKSDNGNILYDVSTSCVIGYPPYYRHITFDIENRSIAVQSTLLDNIPALDTDGLPLSEFTKRLFLGNIEDVFKAAENDFDTFAELAIGISMPKEKSYRLKPLIQLAAKYVNHLTFGRVWRFSRLSNDVTHREISLIKKKKVLPYVVDVIANLFKGDADMRGRSEQRRIQYRVAMGFVKHMDKLTKPFAGKLKALGIDSVSSVVMPLLQNDGISDANAVLKY